MFPNGCVSWFQPTAQLPVWIDCPRSVSDPPCPLLVYKHTYTQTLHSPTYTHSHIQTVVRNRFLHHPCWTTCLQAFVFTEAFLLITTLENKSFFWIVATQGTFNTFKQTLKNALTTLILIASDQSHNFMWFLALKGKYDLFFWRTDTLWAAGRLNIYIGFYLYWSVMGILIEGIKADKAWCIILSWCNIADFFL